jgi:hypothetical protein
MKLKTETNTPEMEERVLLAAYAALSEPMTNLFADFEHGQWWITLKDSGTVFSVADATGGKSVDGFDFEQCN